MKKLISRRNFLKVCALDICDHAGFRLALDQDGTQHQLQRLLRCAVQVDHGVKVAVPHCHKLPQSQNCHHRHTDGQQDLEEIKHLAGSIHIQSQPESGMIADIQSTAERAKMAELLKYATIIISSLPLLVMYPFFQKYFDAGIMAGSIKG